MIGVIMDGMKALAVLGLTGVIGYLTIRFGSKTTTKTTRQDAKQSDGSIGGNLGSVFDLFSELSAGGNSGWHPSGDDLKNAGHDVPYYAGGTQGGLSDLLRTIQKPESGGNYDIVYGGSKLRPTKPLTQMTVAEVMDWQRASVRAGSKSSAAGGYQIINPTLKSLVADGTLDPNETFSPAAQDRAGVALAERRGLNDFLAGNMSPEKFANNLAKEWAGLPVVTGAKKGRSYYAGDGLNAAGVAPNEILSALARLKGA